jgi:ABC-type lipoprotein release transport system permease subunit
MFDILPFPNITGHTQEEQLVQTRDYLYQLKEELEFILTNIGAENLSQELRAQIANLGDTIKTTIEEQDTMNQQMTSKTITVNDVLNSPGYKADLKGVNDRIDALQASFHVNFETGELEYTIT